jgi:hypothetical protein
MDEAVPEDGFCARRERDIVDIPVRVTGSKH